ncbi:SpoIIE family protein phosphatase [Lentzea sp. NPDC058450]|uniref:SpoIIE family protein phosphatase n=1 Tax=Lentzea sp. NPDC058450 TaxID=3346505 RepID=UPI00364F7F28
MADGGELDRQVGAAEVVRRMFDLMPLMVVVLAGPEHRIVAATGAYRAWTGRQTLIGMTLREAFAEGRLTWEMADRVYATGQAESLRGLHTGFDRPDVEEEREFFVDWNLSPTRGPGGEIDGVFIDAVDVTDRVHERRTEHRRAATAERQYAEALDVIDLLHRQMLPSSVPLLPGVHVAASYLPALADSGTGGDWFDAFPLLGGRLGLVVGDVAAAGPTGQLSVVLSERLAATGDVRIAVRAADVVARRSSAARAATVCVAVLDPGTGVVEYAVAGHPPPLVIPAAGEPRFLVGRGGRPLGVGDFVLEPLVGNEILAGGDLLLLYTDGILERPGRSMPESTVEFSAAATDAMADRGAHLPAADRVCDLTIETLTRFTGHRDDITLLAAQLVPHPPEFHRAFPAVVESVSLVREEVADWLTGLHLDPLGADALLHGVVELATNAAEHAYLDSPGNDLFVVHGELLADAHVRIEVSDEGRWRTPNASTDRGLGLQITAEMVDGLRVEHDGGGTRSVLRHRASRPTRLHTAEDLRFGFPLATRVPVRAMELESRPGSPNPCLSVAGPMDATTADQFKRAVHSAGFTGTRSLTIDLTGVTHLASAGVALLHALTARHRDNGSELTLFAPVGTPADMIMTLVGLGHHTSDLDR